MPQYADYLSSVIPEPFRVLGVALRPFCLGHLLLLTRLDSEFISAGEPDRYDLILGLLICSSTFEAGRELAADGVAMQLRLGELSRRLGGGWFRSRPLDWEASFKLFADYLEDGQRRPDVWQYHSDGPGMTAPWQEIVSVTLTRTGWTETEIMNCYLPRLWIRYYTAMEMRMFEVAKSREGIQRIFVSDLEREFFNRKVTADAK